MDYVASFFAGAFLCNCIPHLACGLRGETFPTPFCPLSRRPVTIGFELGFLALVLGALAIGTYLSLHFGTARRDKLC